MVSIIIQGPLISKGITGAFNPKEKGYRTVIFDCRKNLDTIISKYGHLFDNIIICTWKNQEVTYNNKNAKILYLEDTFDHEYLKTTNAKIPKINNKQRQFYSTLKGCEYLESIGYKGNVLKFRTDQIIDFTKAKAFFEKEKDSDKIFIPFILLKHDKAIYPKIHFSDYYFYGQLSNIKTLCSIQLKEKERANTPHRDVFFRYAWHKFGETLGVDEKFYHQRTPFIYKQNAKIAEKAYDELFAPMPKSCLATLIWRGEPISPRILEYIYYEEWKSGTKEQYLFAIRNNKKPFINFLNYQFAIDESYNGYKPNKIKRTIGKYYTYAMYFFHLQRRLDFVRRKLK